MIGKLNLVSVGPGFAELIAPLAKDTLSDCDCIVGYDLYMTWIAPWIVNKELFTAPLTKERERAVKAIELARAGKKVALISSGDIGIYAMAALAFDEMSEEDVFDVSVVPGITAANACASLLGSPLSHDFATLSLSDLLCPWDWIEERARHIAAADLAVALYNVQSKTRQSGVYRIIDIMLEHKAAGTICGLVKNAYRDQQTTTICTLNELRDMRFDMFTTLIIGNRFTRAKRNWIFTPRGYNSWLPDADRDLARTPPPANPELPEGAVWVFSGTGDGNALAQAIAATGTSVVVSTASEYGGALASELGQNVHVVSGRLGTEKRRQSLIDNTAQAIVDATHPHAEIISRQLIELADQTNIPYIRYEREASPRFDHIEAFDSIESAATRALSAGKRIFLATGSKELESVLSLPGADKAQWFIRIAPDAEFVQRAVRLGIPRSHICAMQGPFSAAFNQALWSDWSIDCVVTKESGPSGGFTDKVAAAGALGIPIFAVSRPALAYPQVASDFQSILNYLNSQAESR